MPQCLVTVSRGPKTTLLPPLAPQPLPHSWGLSLWRLQGTSIPPPTWLPRQVLPASHLAPQTSAPSLQSLPQVSASSPSPYTSRAILLNHLTFLTSSLTPPRLRPSSVAPGPQHPKLLTQPGCPGHWRFGPRNPPCQLTPHPFTPTTGHNHSHPSLAMPIHTDHWPCPCWHKQFPAAIPAVLVSLSTKSCLFPPACPELGSAPQLSRYSGYGEVRC